MIVQVCFDDQCYYGASSHFVRFALVFACEVQKKVRYSTCARRNNFYGLLYDNHVPRRRRRPPRFSPPAYNETF